MKVWVGHTVTSSHYLRPHGYAIIHRWKTPFGKQLGFTWVNWEIAYRWESVGVDQKQNTNAFVLTDYYAIRFSSYTSNLIAVVVVRLLCFITPAFFFLVPNLFPTSMLNTSLVDLWPLIFPRYHSEFLCLPTIISRKSTFVKRFLFLFSEYFWQILGWNNKTWHKMSKVPTTTAYIKFSILSKKWLFQSHSHDRLRRIHSSVLEIEILTRTSIPAFLQHSWWIIL